MNYSLLHLITFIHFRYWILLSHRIHGIKLDSSEDYLFFLVAEDIFEPLYFSKCIFAIEFA
jgi:hypothetical protein